MKVRTTPSAPYNRRRFYAGKILVELVLVYGLDETLAVTEIPKYPTSNYQAAVSKTPTPRVVRTYRQIIPKQTCLADRFISRRCEYSVEAANYLLKQKANCNPKKNQLDVFKQVDNLAVTWRKKYMHRLMVKENAIPGVRQKQVLRSNQLSSENRLPGNLIGQPKDLWDEEYFEDSMWKAKPRMKPLIGIMDSILDMPGFQALPRLRFRFIDWSSRDLVAAAIQDAITFYDTRVSQTAELSPLENIYACTLKWSNNGEKLAICTMSSTVNLYDVVTQKIVWTATCKCLLTYNLQCFVRCVCWSYNDRHIVTGCRGLLSIYLAATGSLVNTLHVHTAGILTLSFSSNYQYLVTSAPDTSVRVFLWPSLIPFLDISYYEPVKAIAWHPHESALLCIGGGLGDASLSLWNVNKLDPLSYRRVQFHGAVENLAWNKVSGELVVQWSYWEARNRYTVMPVLASLDRIVDVLPLEKESRVSFVMWNSDHTQLATLAHESLSIWNFFGDEYQNRQKHSRPPKNADVRRNSSTCNFREFKHFNIR